MTYFRDSIERMAGYTPGEQPQDKKYIKLNTNESPYPPSPRVIEAIRAAANADLRLYPDPTARRLREKIARLHGVSADEVIAGQGGDDVLNIIVRACAGKGDKVASVHPSYGLYHILAELQEADYVRVKSVRDLAATGAQVCFACNPNAPTGLWTPLDVMHDLAPRVTGLLVIDEAYADFAEATCIPLVQEHPNVVVPRSMSKSLSLAGMRLGYAVAQPHVIEQLFKVKDSYNLDRISLAAAEAAIDDIDYARANVRKVIATRERVAAELSRLGLFAHPSRANFIFFRVENAGEVKQTLKDRGILVRHWDAPDLRDFIRVSIGSDPEMDAFLAELKTIIARP